MTTSVEHPVVERLLARARAEGAEAADAWVVERSSLSASVRMGKLEGVEREETRQAALRILIGKRQAAAIVSDVRDETLDALAARVAAMARAAAEDPYCGLAPSERLARGPGPDLALFDPTERGPDALEHAARATEEAGLAVPGVGNSGGAGADWTVSRAAFGTSAGFRGAHAATSFGVGLSLVAERDGAKERDWEARDARWLADLPDPARVGRTAGERTVARLGGRKIDSQTAPVIFEARTAGRILATFASAVNGAAVARGASFLKRSMGERVFADGVDLIDDPLRAKGWSSHAFDGEGAACARRAIVDDGVLTTWFLNCATARQLGLETTGHATAGVGHAPGVGPSNLTLRARAPQARTIDDLMALAGRGLVVQEMFSPSFNQNTGDYSVGVSGFWFESGRPAYPVNEVTVAGDLKDIYRRLIPADDHERRSAIDAPSLLVDALSIAGR